MISKQTQGQTHSIFPDRDSEKGMELHWGGDAEAGVMVFWAHEQSHCSFFMAQQKLLLRDVTHIKSSVDSEQGCQNSTAVVLKPGCLINSPKYFFKKEIPGPLPQRFWLSWPGGGLGNMIFQRAFQVCYSLNINKNLRETSVHLPI